MWKYFIFLLQSEAKSVSKGQHVTLYVSGAEEKTTAIIKMTWIPLIGMVVVDCGRTHLAHACLTIWAHIFLKYWKCIRGADMAYFTSGELSDPAKTPY